MKPFRKVLGFPHEHVFVFKSLPVTYWYRIHFFVLLNYQAGQTTLFKMPSQRRRDEPPAPIDAVGKLNKFCYSYSSILRLLVVCLFNPSFSLKLLPRLKKETTET